MPAVPLPKKDAQVLQARESNKNKKYSELRDREYLLESEVKSMMQAAKTGRWGHRDALLILMGYRHGAQNF